MNIGDQLIQALQRTNSALRMDEDAFDNTFKPFENPREESWHFFDFEPEDKLFLDQLDPHHIWTEVDYDGDEDEKYHSLVIPGRHWVNRIGYIVTLVPWSPDQAELVVDVS